MAYEIPIVFCVYNRPDLSRQVLNAIRKKRPRKILIVADGPKPNNDVDGERVEATRRLIEEIDWNCDLLTCMADENMGCRQRMATGLTWAFDQVDQLVVLEDDCLPNDTFFNFCREMLQRYEDDERIMMISGNRFFPSIETETSYYFSRWTHIWGWASWSRAWQKFDVQIPSWPEIFEQNILRNIVSSTEEYAMWTNVFDRVFQGEIDTWDFSWMYACWVNLGLTIIPPKNLVKNIGFGNRATHTLDENSKLANLKTEEVVHFDYPNSVARNLSADTWTFENIFSNTLNAIPRSTGTQRAWWNPWKKAV